MHDYLYLSERRLEDLSAQIESARTGKIAAGLVGSIPGVLKASVKAESSTSTPSWFDTLRRVEKALQRDGKIGPIGTNEDWLEGSLEMYWGASNSSGTFGKLTPVVFFGGTRGCQAVLLGGSQKHLRTAASTDAPSTSDLPQILSALAAHEASPDPRTGGPAPSEAHAGVWEAIDYCHGNWGGVRQTMSFLAKRLQTCDGFEYAKQRWRITIAAPLYVRR